MQERSCTFAGDVLSRPSARDVPAFQHFPCLQFLIHYTDNLDLGEES
jgi:hypothetical protein